ncbi:hypothetical protein GCM10028784_10270 [Myceligenerans cantabricum]
MSRTPGGTTPRRATALLTALLLSGTTLAGCSADSDPEAEAPTTAASPSGMPSPSEAEESSPAPSDEPTSEPTGSGEPTPDRTPTDEPSVAGTAAADDDDDPGEDEGKQDDDRGNDDEQDDDEKQDENRTDEPELPDHIAFGESSERVADVQQRLQELGYYVTSADGAYGGETQQALWALQKAGGLYRDGVVGPETQQALDAGTVPRPKSTSGKVVEIDISRQLLLAVENGRVVKTINAASGNGERFEAKGTVYTASTPRGDFTVYHQIDGMHASTLELGDMWRPKYFNGGIAVHGAASVPPFPASHGCVRVSNAAMDWLWDTWGADPGTRVLVY